MGKTAGRRPPPQALRGWAGVRGGRFFEEAAWSSVARTGPVQCHFEHSSARQRNPFLQLVSSSQPRLSLRGRIHVVSHSVPNAEPYGGPKPPGITHPVRGGAGNDPKPLGTNVQFSTGGRCGAGTGRDRKHRPAQPALKSQLWAFGPRDFSCLLNPSEHPLLWVGHGTCRMKSGVNSVSFACER